MGGSNNATKYANQQQANIQRYLAPYQNAFDLPALANIISSGGQGGGILPMNTAVSMAQNNAATAGLNAQEAMQRQANQRMGASVGSGIADGNVAAFQDLNAQNIAAAGNQTAMNQQQLQNQNFNNIATLLAGIINGLYGGSAQIGNAGVNNANYNWLTGNSGLMGALSGTSFSNGANSYKFSDRRLKSNIEHVGNLGPLKVYEYDIDGRRERGVMAQEAKVLYPEAVLDGDEKTPFMVNYKRLKELVGQND